MLTEMFSLSKGEIRVIVNALSCLENEGMHPYRGDPPEEVEAWESLNKKFRE